MSRAAWAAVAALWTVAAPLAVMGSVGAFKAGQEVLARPENGRLIGYGCRGAAGEVVAQEESDFPPCQRIEVREGRTAWAAVVEHSNGESDVVERGSLLDCMAALPAWRDRPETVSAYCEREAAK